MIGDYRHLITISQPVDTTTDGETTQTWQVLATVWARIQPLDGAEYWQAAQRQTAISHRITLREYVSNVTTKCQVRRGTTTFGIEAVINPELLNRSLVLMCREVPA